MLMVSPALQKHISEELHRESQTIKERRNIHEERALARTPGKGDDDVKQLKKKVETQAAELRRLQNKGPEGGEAAKGGGRGGRKGDRGGE